jgi:creatinine amidohydrolase
MSRGLNISEMSWREFAERAPNTRLALVPVGSVEAYGPHLPLGTDGLVALAVAKRLSERIGCLVGPLVPVGWTAVLADFPGTLSVPTHTLKAYCKGIAESLLRPGIKSIIFINGHAGNVAALDELCYELAEETKNTFLGCVNTWQFIQPLSGHLLASGAHKFGHAAELNTSIMLHLYPELVNMDRALASAPVTAMDPQGIARPYRFSEVAPEATLGDATLATAEKGKQIFELAVERLVEYLSASGAVGTQTRLADDKNTK